ncbi:response regulator transcription factor [Phytohabitans houttuyneae]|uniref:DNA-binding response regulator n=1 Tax=Phytohabitans houttuyneae TaxID=1076126 RepID=A0A6V8KHW4_9ACTN|nr:response regulator transcription factor [Phytohabitans houttuyneae]GFJ81596.1 DNA-binding response regulator [Phytohabitans houttuyneae]
MIRVLVADDQMLVRAGLRMILDEPDIALVEEAGTGEEAVALARAHLPDVVLMDVRMPGLDGLAATRRIVADPALDAVRVVVLTTYDLDAYVYEALRSGASGFLLKDAGHAEILAGVRAAAGGGALLSPAVTRRLIDEFAARPPRQVDGTGLDRLTDREHQVLLLVAAGLNNDEVGQRLGMSPATAKTHVTRIQAKLGARDRVQLVVLAYETRLVRPGWLV